MFKLLKYMSWSSDNLSFLIWKFHCVLWAVVQNCSVKKVFLEILQNSQENTCAWVFFNNVAGRHRCFPVNFAKFVITPFSYRTPPVAASVVCKINYSTCQVKRFNLYHKDNCELNIQLLNFDKLFQKTLLECAFKHSYTNYFHIVIILLPPNNY